MDRYNIAPTKSVKPSAQTSVSKTRTLDEVKRDIAGAMMNDYDTRRTMEAAAMAGNKDAKKYAKKGIDADNIQDAYGVMRDLKKEYVGGGGMDGAENRAGLTFARPVNADRDALNASIDSRFDAMSVKEQEGPDGFTYTGPDAEISPEMQDAKDRVAAYKATSGQGDPSPYGPKGSALIMLLLLFTVLVMISNRKLRLWLIRQTPRQIRHSLILINKRRR